MVSGSEEVTSVGPNVEAREAVIYYWGVRRFECLTPTLQRCHRLSAAQDRTVTVVSS